MRTRYFAVLVLAILGSLVFTLESYPPALAYTINCREPPFINPGVQSNVLIILDNSGSMNGFAYYEDTGKFSQEALTPQSFYVYPPTSTGSCRDTSHYNCPGYSASTCTSPVHQCTDTVNWAGTGAMSDCVGTCTYNYICKTTGSGKNKRCIISYVSNPSCVMTAGTCNFTTSYSSSNNRNTVSLTEGSSSNHTAAAGYDRGFRYYGLFDPDKLYKYNATKHYFYTQDGWTVVDPGNVTDSNGNRVTIRGASLTSGGTSDKFSGNFLNWLTMRRMDVAKKVLTGGRLGGDPTEYVLVGSPMERDYYKVFNDNGGDGVYYTPFKTPFGVYFYTSKDLVQRTGSNAKFVPLFVFFGADSYDTSTNTATRLGALVSLGVDRTDGNTGESDMSGQRSYDGSYYVATKVGTVADNEPPAGIVQNMASKVRMGFMQFNYGVGPADSAYGWYELGDVVDTYDINGDNVTDLTLRYADGGRVLNPVGDATRVNSFQVHTDLTPVTQYAMVKNINEILWEMYTPISEVLREAKRYFQQVPPAYAWVDSAGTVQQDYQVNNTWDPYYYSTAQPPGKQSCAQSYIILVSDGEENSTHPNYDSCKTINCNWRTDAASTEYSADFRFNDTTTYMDDIAYIMHTQDMRSDISDSSNPSAIQTISLYSILVFADNANAKNDMQSAALAGGFVDLDRDGEPGSSGNSSNSWPASYTWSGYTGYFEWDVDKDGNPDHFFMASDGYLLESYIQSIFNKVALGGAAGAVATISQDTKQADIIVRGAFDAVDPTDRTHYLWNGHLEVYWPDSDGKYEFEYPTNSTLFCKDMTAGGDGSKCCWDAGQKMQAIATTTTMPRVFSYVKPDQVDLNGTNASQFVDLMRQKVTAPLTASQGVVSEDKAAAIIQWARGAVDSEGYPLSDAGEPIPSGCVRGSVSNPCIGPYRNRNGSKLGDIVYSTPVVVGPPPLGGVSAADPDIGSFNEFRNDNLTRARVAYVGANDGMLHAYLLARWEVNSTTGIGSWNYQCSAGSDGYPACGQEIWSYVPSNLLSELFALAAVDYGNMSGGSCRHRSMVDLSDKAWDVYIHSSSCSASATCGTTKRCWRTVIIGGERGGGDTYFAIDVTDPVDPKVLWEHSVLQNLAVAYESSGTKMTLPYRQSDNDNDGYEDVYFNLKTIPMSWSEPLIGRVRFPATSESGGVSFWRYVNNSLGVPVLEKRSFSTDCGDNKREIAFIGGGFRVYNPYDLGVSPNPSNSTILKALTKPYLLALDVETGENLFQTPWALLVKARTDAGKLPDLPMPASSTTQYVPWAFGDPALLDVWNDKNGGDDTGNFAEDGFVDRMYVGDLHGFLYRMAFNFKTFLTAGNNPTNWGVHINYWPTKQLRLNLTDATSCDQQDNFRGCRQPITYAPAVAVDSQSVSTSSPALRVLFGTGKFDDVTGANDDKTDSAQMSFYNLKDDVKLFCTTSSGTTTCTALPAISPAGSGVFTITPASTAGNPDTVTVSGSGLSNGFTIAATHFGIMHGDGVCYSETSTDASKKLVWSHLNCTQTTTSCGTSCKNAVRSNCCDWAITASQPDCCESPCGTKTCDSNNQCTPCWSCIFDFPNLGERVVGKPVIAGGYAFFSTYYPGSNSCQSGGTGTLYILDYRCKTFPDNFNPFLGTGGYTVINLNTSESTPHKFGVSIDLGTGLPSRPVLDSKGESVLIQKSDGGFIRFPAPKYLVSPIQFKGGWSEK